MICLPSVAPSRPLTPRPAACAAEFGGNVDSKAILDFVDSGNHLVLAAGSDASDTIRSLALECGVELDDKGAAVYDHFHHQAAGGASDPTLITTTAVVEAKAVFGSQQPKVRAAISLLGLATACASTHQPTSRRSQAAAKRPEPWRLQPPQSPSTGLAALTALPPNTPALDAARLQQHPPSVCCTVPCDRCAPEPLGCWFCCMCLQAPILFKGAAATVPSSSDLVSSSAGGNNGSSRCWQQQQQQLDAQAAAYM